MIQHHIRQLDHFVSPHANLTAMTIRAPYAKYQVTYSVVPNLNRDGNSMYCSSGTVIDVAPHSTFAISFAIPSEVMDLPLSSSSTT